MKITQILILLLSFYSLRADSEITQTEPTEQPGQKEEKFVFQAEISRLLDIIINSFYTHKDVFLREVVSNASDALDKVRFMALQDQSINRDEKKLEIKIIPNKEEGTLTIQDTGIGMNREDLINNLGTIAHSGTTQFLDAIKNAENLNLIGQFGVGFYSYFLVANRVTVISKKAGEDQWIWSSEAGSNFVIIKDEQGEQLTRGTKIVLSLKDDMKQYLEEQKLKDLIKKYSQFVQFPVLMKESVTKKEEVALTEEELLEQEQKQAKEQEEAEAKGETYEPKEKKTVKEVEVKVEEWKPVNQEKAIWMKEISKVTPEEYKEFYKTFDSDLGEPLDQIHFKVEGEIEFTALIYIPKVLPYMALMRQMNQKKSGKNAAIKLFVRRVMISENFDGLLPKYFQFVKGIVDSDDLPLNVSRENLQNEKAIKVIKKQLVKKIIDRLTKYSKQDIDDEYLEEEENLSDEQLAELDKKIEKRKKEMVELYEQFWSQNGSNIKQGIIEDKTNAKGLAKISLWRTTYNGTSKFTSLDKYIERKKANQTEIYYLGGESIEEMQQNPVLKGLVSKGFEIILCPDPIDEYSLKQLEKYEEIKLTNISMSGFQVPQDDKEKRIEKKLKEYYEPLSKWVSDVLKDDVESVQIKQFDPEISMVVLSTDKGYSAHMQNILKYQSQMSEEERKMQMGNQKRIVVLNPYHPFIKELLDRVKGGADKDTEDNLRIIYNSALIKGGFDLKDQQGFQKLLQNLLKDQLGLPRNQQQAQLDIDLENDLPETEAPKENSSENQTQKDTVEEHVDNLEEQDEQTIQQDFQEDQDQQEITENSDLITEDFQQEELQQY